MSYKQPGTKERLVFDRSKLTAQRSFRG